MPIVEEVCYDSQTGAGSDHVPGIDSPLEERGEEGENEVENEACDGIVKTHTNFAKERQFA